MDISAIVVVLVLMVLSFAAIVWMEIHSRKTKPEDGARDRKGIGLSEE